MEKNVDNVSFDVFGAFLMLIGIASFVCYFFFRDIAGFILGFIYGIVGIAFVYISKKINEKKIILSSMLFILSAVISILNIIPETIAVILILICGASSLFFVLKPPAEKIQQ